MKTGLLIIFTIFISLAAGVQTASACMCARPDPVDAEFERFAVVGVFKLVSVDDGPEPTGDDVNLTQRAVAKIKFRIEKVYKGTLRAGTTVALEQLRLTGCDHSFFAEQTGTSFLFYLDTDPSAGPKWRVFGCSRSGDVKGAAADLLYLEKMAQVRGKTRLSGIVKQAFVIGGGANPRTDLLADSPVIITGKGKTVQLKTDKNGVYEIYGLAPGRYRVTPVKIKGYGFTGSHGLDYAEVDIRAGAHTEQNFDFGNNEDSSGP